MNDLTPTAVRTFVLERLTDQLTAIGLTAADVPENFDLLTTGTIDSLGLLELVGALEERFGVTTDFSEMDPDDIGVLGPLCVYVVDQAGAGLSQ